VAQPPSPPLNSETTSRSATNTATEKRRVIVVINPATKGNPDKTVSIITAQAPQDVMVDIRRTQAGVSVAELLGTDLIGATAIIAAGGDGTVSAVATAIGDSGIPLGIIPVGSTNIIAREQRIPLNAAKAARLIFGQHTLKPLDVGICGNRRFLHMAGAGIDSRLFLATDREKKRRFGWLAYLGPALRNLTAPPSHFTITIDGSTIETSSPLVLVANGPSILNRQFPVYRDIRSDDGWLDVIVLTATSPLPIVATVGRLLTRQIARSRHVVRIRARTVELTAKPALPLQLDGDVVGETPARFTVHPGAIRLIVPRKKK
jgi:YegS/Rv2252/BmrU family lipid kinase